MFQYDLFVVILDTKTPYFNQLIQICKHWQISLNIHYPLFRNQYRKEKVFVKIISTITKVIPYLYFIVVFGSGFFASPFSKTELNVNKTKVAPRISWLDETNDDVSYIVHFPNPHCPYTRFYKLSGDSIGILPSTTLLSPRRLSS